MSLELCVLNVELFHVFYIDRNLEQIVKAHQSKPQHGQSQLSDETKFKMVSAANTVV